MLGSQNCSHDFLKNLVACAAAIVLLGATSASFAVDAAKPAKVAKPAAKAAAAKKPAAVVLDDATPEQLEAAKLVYYGTYECEFKQVVEITENGRNYGYVDVKLGKDQYVMKPVLSSTGALRMEDVKGETLMVQIANKSMLLNVKAGRRLVDDCVSPKQRELIQAAAKAKSEAAAAAPIAATADAASAPK
jgi:hypothetical protein